MNKFGLKTIIICFIAAAGLFVAGTSVFAQTDPKAVDLASFNVTPLDNAVRIDWETGTELETLGFFIKRGPVGGPEETLTYLGENGIIYATGSGIIGDSYSVTDTQVQNGQTYTYVLYEIENDGTEIRHNNTETTVTVGIPPTNTPVVASGGTGGGSAATATSRPTQTATRQPTATNSPSTRTTASASPPATATAPAFVTITPRTNPPTATATPQSVNNTNAAANDSSGSVNAVQPTATATPAVVSSSGNEVFALEEEEPEAVALQPAAQTQDDYPGATPTTAVLDAPTAYPENISADTTTGDPAATPLPVIGGQGYDGSQSQDTTNAPAGGGSQNTLFLWLGFIVALLIFATGVIGSILLFIRKAN